MLEKFDGFSRREDLDICALSYLKIMLILILSFFFSF